MHFWELVSPFRLTSYWGTTVGIQRPWLRWAMIATFEHLYCVKKVKHEVNSVAAHQETPLRKKWKSIEWDRRFQFSPRCWSLEQVVVFCLTYSSLPPVEWCSQLSSRASTLMGWVTSFGLQIAINPTYQTLSHGRSVNTAQREWGFQRYRCRTYL